MASFQCDSGPVAVADANEERTLSSDHSKRTEDENAAAVLTSSVPTPASAASGAAGSGGIGRVGGRWVFSYGSNSVAQLSARVESPNLAQHNFAARVDGYVRCFCFYGATWGGTAATIHPVQARQQGGASVTTNKSGESFVQDAVYGTVTYLSAVELGRLDAFEGGYSKVSLDVTVLASALVAELGSIRLKAIAYVSNSPAYKGLPSEAYLTAIRIMLSEHDYGQENNAVAQTIVINGVVDGQVVAVSTWKPPLVSQLSMSALVVHINSLRTNKWVMPRSMRQFVDSCAAVGVHSTAQLAMYLLSEEGILKLKSKLAAARYDGAVMLLDEEAVALILSALDLPREAMR
jgi:hypothetical protein